MRSPAPSCSLPLAKRRCRQDLRSVRGARAAKPVTLHVSGEDPIRAPDELGGSVGEFARPSPGYHHRPPFNRLERPTGPLPRR